jgi:hypothetical protein
MVRYLLGTFLKAGVFSSQSAIERHNRIASGTEFSSKTKPVFGKASSISCIQGFTPGWASNWSVRGIQAELLSSVEVHWGHQIITHSIGRAEKSRLGELGNRAFLNG